MQKRLKRVLYVDHTAVLGGGEIALLALLHELDRSVFEPVVLLLSDGPLTEELAGLAETHLLEMPKDLMGTRRDDLSGSEVPWRKFLSLLKYLRALSATLRRLQPQIVHTNSLKADLLAGLVARYQQVPQVWHIRDRITEEYLPKLAVRTFRFLCRILPNALIANSQSTLDSLGRQGGERAVVISSGLNLAAFAEAGRRSLPLSTVIAEGQEVQIGIVGRISPWKGQDVFLRAAALVRREFPNARFHLVGAPLFDERDFEAVLESLTSELGLKQHVIFAGFRRDVPDYIGKLHIVVHASTIPEPFGQVIIQGMAGSKPVIASEGGGPSEIIVSGSTGLLVRRGDSSALAEAILHVLKNPGVAEVMAQLAQQQAFRRYGAATTTREVEAVYQRLLAAEC